MPEYAHCPGNTGENFLNISTKLNDLRKIITGIILKVDNNICHNL